MKGTRLVPIGEPVDITAWLEWGAKDAASMNEKQRAGLIDVLVGAARYPLSDPPTLVEKIGVIEFRKHLDGMGGAELASLCDDLLNDLNYRVEIRNWKRRQRGVLLKKQQQKHEPAFLDCARHFQAQGMTVERALRTMEQHEVPVGRYTFRVTRHNNKRTVIAKLDGKEVDDRAESTFQNKFWPSARKSGQ
jgi:hypothetical protein